MKYYYSLKPHKFEAALSTTSFIMSAVDTRCINVSAVHYMCINVSAVDTTGVLMCQQLTLQVY